LIQGGRVEELGRAVVAAGFGEGSGGGGATVCRRWCRHGSFQQRGWTDEIIWIFAPVLFTSDDKSQLSVQVNFMFNFKIVIFFLRAKFTVKMLKTEF
jgi:hypothetical protein